MTCNEQHTRMDDYIDGQLQQTLRDAFDAHLKSCASCRKALTNEQAFRAELKALPVPAASAGFADRVLQQAAGSAQQVSSRHRRSGFVTGFGSALVAGLALWVVVGFFPAQMDVTPDGKAPLQMVTIALNETQDVKLVFNAEQVVLGAKISIELPDNVAIAGYPGRRHLQWQTDLAKGSNLLRLPVVGSMAEAGQLVAHIEHDNKVTTLTIQINVQNPGLTGNLILPKQRSA